MGNRAGNPRPDTRSGPTKSPAPALSAALPLSLLLLALCPAPAPAQTTTIETTTTAPARITFTSGTHIIDVAEGATYTFSNLAVPTDTWNAAIAANNTANPITLRITGGGTTVFISNTVTGAGAAIAFRPNPYNVSVGGLLDLQNVRFGDRDNPALGNSAGSGGAITVRGASTAGADAVLNLVNGEFYGNKATTSNGGAIEVSEVAASSTIKGTVFERNTAGSGASGVGGAIYYNTVRLHTLTSATFGVAGDLAYGNYAASRGGAIFAANGATLALTDVAFYGNISNTTNGQGGGAIFLAVSALISTTINGAVFEQNAARGGGALYIGATNGTTVITSATFGNPDDATRGNLSYGTNGGAIYQAGPNHHLSLTDVAFHANKIIGSNAGGAVYLSGTLSGTYAAFHDNQTGGNGGAIAIAGGRLILNSATFQNNQAGNGGGAIYNNASFTELTNVIFQNNKATGSNGGGAIYINTGSTEITNATFQNNQTTGNNSGGAIYINAGFTEITNATFRANQTGTGGGGAIYINAGTLAINGALFASNTSSSHGSAININESVVRTTIASATFSQNTTLGSIHATVFYYAYNGSGTAEHSITDSLFDRNLVGNGGGAILVSGMNKPIHLTIDRTTFSANVANQGGALWGRDGGTWFTVNDSLFTSNTARGLTGGAISLHLGGRLDINATVSATHSGNRAADAASGGFLYLADSATIGVSSTANINIAPAATVTIGGVSAAHDTISTGTFTSPIIYINNDPAAVAADPDAGMGTLILANGDSSSQRGTINIAAGRLLLANSATLGGIINVASGAVFGGQGVLNSAAGGALNRTVTIQTGGTFQLGGDGAVGTGQSFTNSGTITFADGAAIIGSGYLGTASGSGFLLGSAPGDTITVYADETQWIHLNNGLAGPGSILKTGSGVLGLGGANTFTGGVTLASGTLRLVSGTALGTGTLAVTGTGAFINITTAQTIPNTLVLNHTTGFTIINNVTVSLTGTLSGPGGLMKEGASRLNLDGTLTNIPSVALTGGTLAATGGLANVPLVSISNTAVYAGDLARAAGQTLAISTVGGGQITGALTLANTSTLAFDLADATASSTAALRATGSFAITGTATFDFAHLGNDTYKIVSASTIAATTANFNYTVNGAPLTGRNALVFTLTATDIAVQSSYRNLRVTYAAAGAAAWDDTSANWTDASTSNTGETRFNTGDSVRFLDATGTLAIAAAGITAGDIEIDGDGALTFAGGALATDTAAASVDGAAGLVALTTAGTPTTAAATGKLLKKGAGTLILANDSGSFAGGLEIEAGALVFNRAAQLGDAATGTVSFTGPATLRADADILGTTGTLAGTLALATGVSGTLDTQGFTVESVATLASTGGAAASLIKTGAGTLILRATDNTAFAAPTTVAAGALLLADGAKLGGALTVSPAATAGGAGAFTGDVTVADNATLLVGSPSDPAAAGALAIGGALTLTGSARVNFGIRAGGLADTLDVTGVLTAATASNIVALTTSGVIDSGTYALGRAAALADVQNLEVNDVRIDDSLRIVSKLSANSGTLLFIYGTDDSRYMEWTGATGTATWNIGLANWQSYNGDTAGKTKYQDGDTIRLATTADTTITLAAAATITDLIVDNTGLLTLAGAALTAAPGAAHGALIQNPSGKLIKTGPGALLLANASNTFAGGIALDAGALLFTTAAQLGAAPITATNTTAGPAGIAAAATLRPLANTTLGNTLTLATADGAPPLSTLSLILDTPETVTLTLNGTTTGAGALAKTGDGILVLSGTGALGHPATAVAGGLVLLRDIPAADAPGVTHTFALDGGWLDLSVAAGFNPANPDPAAAIDWSGLVITGTAGAVIGSNDKITLRAGATLPAIGGTTTAQQGLFVVVDAAGGAATLTGAGNYAGRTLLQSGTLRISANDQLGLLSLNREIRFTGTGAALEITADGFVSNRPLILDENAAIGVTAGASGTWTGLITGVGKTLTKTGAGELFITNTSNSPTLSYSIADGSLVLTGTTGSFATTATSTFVLNQTTGTATYTPNVTGNGTFEKRGAGTLMLITQLASTGPVHVAAGAIKASINDQFNSASPLSVDPGAILDLRGTRQTAASLNLSGTLLVSATVNSTAGVILASDYLKLTGSVAGDGTIVVNLTESPDDGYSPIYGAKPTSSVLIESTDNTADFDIVAASPADAIFGWDVTRDGTNWLLGQKRLVPVIPAVAGINAALQIATRLSLDTIAGRLDQQRRLDNARPRTGNDWFVSAAYRHDTINAPLYRDATAITKTLAAGVNLTPSKARALFSYGIYTDFVETQLRLPDAETHTKTNTIAASLAWQPNSSFHAEAIFRAAKTRHEIQVEGMDKFRIGATGAGATLALGYTIKPKSGWIIDLRERLSAHITGIEQAFDSAHREYQIADLASFRAGAGVQFSKNILLCGRWPFRPFLALDYDHEIKADGTTTILRYYDADRLRLRDRHHVTDDLSGGALAATAGAAIRFNPRLELAADLSTTLTGPLQDYTTNLYFAWRW